MTRQRIRISPKTRRLIAARKTLRLDLGCGPNKVDGTFGIDIRNVKGVDLVHDLTETPWPLPDNIARVAFMSHYWEHILPWRTLAFMAELHRVLQHDAQVLISGPYGVEFRFVQDPTHCNPTNEATFAYWDKLHPSGLWHVYEPPVFHLERFDYLPAGTSRDFNVILRCCKATRDEDCLHEVPEEAPAKKGSKKKGSKR